MLINSLTNVNEWHLIVKCYQALRAKELKAKNQSTQVFNSFIFAYGRTVIAIWSHVIIKQLQKAMIHISIWTFLTTPSYYTNLIMWYYGSKIKILTFEINHLFIIVNCILKLKGLSLVFLLYWCLIQNIILIFIIVTLHLNINCITTITIIFRYYITIRFNLIDFQKNCDKWPVK